MKKTKSVLPAGCVAWFILIVVYSSILSMVGCGIAYLVMPALIP